MLFLSVVVGLVLAEVGLRSIYEPFFHVKSLPALSACTEPDSLLGYRLRSNLRDHRVIGEMGDTPVSFGVSTNALGLRSPKLLPKGRAYRILIVGDSCTFGLGVNDDETYPARLAKLLNETDGEPDYEVINAGVPGYTSWQGIRYLRERGLQLEPNLVVVCVGNNDIQPLDEPDHVGLLPVFLKGGFVQELLMRLALYRTILSMRISRANQERLEAAKREGAAIPSTLDAYRDNLAEMARLCKQEGVPLAFMRWPLKVQILADKPGADDNEVVRKLRTFFETKLRNQEAMRLLAAEHGVHFVDPLPAMKDAKGRELYLNLIHGNSDALEIIAKALYRALRSAGLLKDKA